VKNFHYLNADSKAKALELLEQEKPVACLVAGGTNVMPWIKDEILQDKTLINIAGLDELRFIRETGDSLEIGPLTCISQLAASDLVAKYARALYQAANDFADPTTRNSATIGGNIANASPAADTATPLLALGARVHVESTAGARTIAIEDFFKGVNKTALLPEELITCIQIPKNQANSSSAFIKLGLRNSMAISVISMATALRLEKGKVVAAAVALGSVAPTPVLARKTAEFLLGRELAADTLDQAKNMISDEIHPIDDLRASAAYRKEMAAVLLGRTLAAAAE